MTDVIANLFVDVHSSKAKLTSLLMAIASYLDPVSVNVASGICFSAWWQMVAPTDCVLRYMTDLAGGLI